MFLSAEPSCRMFILQLEKHYVLLVLLAYYFFPLHQHSIVYSEPQNKMGFFFLFCLFINYQDIEEIMEKRMMCQKQFKSTLHSLPAKERAVCWAYSEFTFMVIWGVNCSNWTKHIIPHISSSQAAESPAGTKWKEHGWLVGVREQSHL